MYEELGITPGRQEGGNCEGEVGLQRGVAVDPHSQLQKGSGSFAASAALLESCHESNPQPDHPYKHQLAGSTMQYIPHCRRTIGNMIVLSSHLQRQLHAQKQSVLLILLHRLMRGTQRCMLMCAHPRTDRQGYRQTVNQT